MTGDDAPERLSGSSVSPAFTEVLRVNPAFGRAFLPEEEQRGANRVVLISDRLWQQRFAVNPAIINQTLMLNGESFTVVGVMPPDFQFPSPRIDVWSPLTLDLERGRNDHFLYAIARLKPDVALAQAQEEMSAIADRLRQQYPESNADSGVNLVSLHEQTIGKARTALLVLLGAVGLVLLIACANVANLLLARAAARQREVAVRTALGASRGRLVRQFLTESLLLAFLGGMLGLLLALWGVDFLTSMSNTIPRAREIGIDGRALGFTLLVSLLTGVVFGLAPALASSKPDLTRSLKEGSKGAGVGLRGNRVRGLLVVSEIALALMLLIGAGLLIRSFARLLEVNPGFDPANVLTMQVSLPENSYGERAQRAAFYRQVLQRIAALPGVEHVGAVNDLPFSGSRTSNSFQIEGRQSNEPMNADSRVINSDYFRAMSIPLLQGRAFTEGDGADAAGVAVINEVMARRFWPDENPIGKRLTFGGDPPREIVGIVAALKHDNLSAEEAPEMYAPYGQRPQSRMSIVVRSTVDPQSLTSAVRGAVREVDPNQPIYNVMTMEQRLASALAPQRFNTLVLGLFAGVALVLAVLGIYGVMSYTVSQRTHEIGVRMALGAQRTDVLRLVTRQGMTLAIIGIIIGLIASFAATRVLTTLLYGVSPTDFITFAVVALILGAAAFIASYIPARRATKVDPMIALRYE